jgi:uncharacterized protein YndB with AHSA1/START domain
MTEQSAIHNTFVIERTYPVPVEKVWAAFADATLKRRWFAEGENSEVEEFAVDFRVGGVERTRYRMGPQTPLPGMILTNAAHFEDIVPGRRVVTASSMSVGVKRISVSLVTVELLPSGRGTELICTNQSAFFEGADGPEIRQAGWRTLFDKLARVLAP